MKFTKDIEVSINLVSLLKHEITPVKVSSLYESLNTTEAFLEQIVNKLRKGGVIEVKRGPNGGVYLSPDKAISVLDIYMAFGKEIESNSNVASSDIPNEVMAHIKNYLGTVICNK